MIFPHETLLFFGILAAGFYMAWSIGANDVANAMGTSVGSGALTLRQAVMIAAVLEFSGAYFFGSHVAETVQTGLVNPLVFTDNPLSFVYGMLSALLGVGIWLQIATYNGWPVSATHSIIGAVVGFGAIVGGVDAIYWDNVAYVFTSWLLSPIFGGLLGFSIFMLLRKHIFYCSHPLAAAKRLMPYLVFVVVFTMAMLLLVKGFGEVEFTVFEAISTSAMIGATSAVISIFFIRRIKDPEMILKPTEIYSPEISLALEKAKKQLLQVQNKASNSMNEQVKSMLNDIESMEENLSHPEEYEVSSQEFRVIENMFSYLQIMSACLMAFAHGANDVANAIGPLSAAILVLKNGTVAATSEVPTWALALGGLGIVVGLATWGWRVIETIGKKLTELTPTRGFAAEFGAALTILVATRFGMPVSTTHTLVGAVVGVGLAKGLEALNLSIMRDIIASWIVTVPAGAVFTMAVYWLFQTFLL